MSLLFPVSSFFFSSVVLLLAWDRIDSVCFVLSQFTLLIMLCVIKDRFTRDKPTKRTQYIYTISNRWHRKMFTSSYGCLCIAVYLASSHLGNASRVCWSIEKTSSSSPMAVDSVVNVRTKFNSIDVSSFCSRLFPSIVNISRLHFANNPPIP